MTSVLVACAPMKIADAPVAAPIVGRSGDYQLTPGDKVHIQVYNEDEMTGDYVLSPGGKIDVPLLGEVRASGLTPGDLATAIQAILGTKLMREPQVAVALVSMRPIYILGEVRTPGEYPATADMTVPNMIAKAGGFTYRANTRYVFVRRKGALREDKLPLTVATPVYPGDTVRVAEQIF